MRVMEVGDEVNISTRAIRVRGWKMREKALDLAERLSFGDPGAGLDQRT
jgi:hypothetical protein